MMTDRIAVATISTANYWPYTAVLLESLARVCPEWEVYVLALNDLPRSGLTANVKILRAEDVWGSETGLCQARLNLFEWAAASKPRLLRFLLDDSGVSLAVYADSDIEFFAPPDSVCAAAGSIILTPNVSATQECESAAWERAHLQFGAFNSGFFAVRNTEEGRSFLTWWDQRITRYCCTDPWLDIFSDQRWLDLVPGLFPGVVVDRNPSLNVATWNVRGRELRVAGGQYRVGDAPLSFFHYHRVRLGMDVDSYLAEVDCHPVVCELVERYLEKAKRYAPVGPVEASRHDRQADGALLPPIVYRAIRDTLAEGLLSFDVREVSTGLTEHLRQISFANKRLRARLRVLAYHSAHTKRSFVPEPNIDRYQRSSLHRLWIDLWYFWNAPRQVQMPMNWTARSEWARRSRKGMTVVLRALRLR
jgi:hypothetical protein